MATAQEHNADVVPMPKWSTWVGFARVALAMLVLAFTAATCSIWGVFPAFGIALFTSCVTLLIFGYYIVALSYKPELYNCWVVLGLEIFGVFFWLVSFALLANWTNRFNGFTRWYGDGDSYGFWNAPYSPEDVGFTKRAPRFMPEKGGHSNRHVGVALAGTAAGLGGLEFCLYSVTLLVFGLALHKQRTDLRAVTTADRTARPIEPEAEPEAEVVEPKPGTAADTV